MATVAGLLAQLKYNSSSKDVFASVATLIESYGAIVRDDELAFSVNQAAIDGISIEFKGYRDQSYPFTYVNGVVA
jgi:hypothetical protein